MQYREMGKTGVSLSVLGFGCMRLPVIGGVTENIDEVQTTELFKEAYDLGVNYWDTAYPYHGGKSEEVTGRILKKLGIRDKIYIATKLPSWLVRDASDLPRLLDEQLARLQTDCIDFYLMHNVTRAFWDRLYNADMVNFINKAKAEGKIKFAGFSMHDKFPHFQEVLASYDWDFAQIQYNYLDIEHQVGQAGVDLIKQKGLGLVIMEPLKGGQLATGLPSDLIDDLHVANPSRSPAEWALRFVLNDGGVTIALSGMNSMAQLTENVSVAERAGVGNLSATEVNLLKGVRESYRARLNVGCTNCMYCMPCPFGVNINGTFTKYNNYGLAFTAETKGILTEQFFEEDQRSGPSKCTSCGACIEKCPQSIDIPTELKKCADMFKEAKEKI